MKLSHLGLLAAILILPAFAVFYTAKLAQAQGAICLANVYSLSAAVQMYAADWDRFPAAERWVPCLEVYCKHYDRQLKCPLDRSGAYSSYGMNSSVSDARPELLPTQPLVVLYETAHPGDNPVGGPEDVVRLPRHPHGVSYAYTDGGSGQRQDIPPFGATVVDRPPASPR
jgi:hypothetical protein